MCEGGLIPLDDGTLVCKKCYDNHKANPLKGHIMTTPSSDAVEHYLLQPVNFTHTRRKDQVDHMINNHWTTRSRETLENETFKGRLTLTYYSIIFTLFDGEYEIGLIRTSNQAGINSIHIYSAEIDGYVESRHMETKDYKDKGQSFIILEFLSKLPKEAEIILNDHDLVKLFT